jgi:hypothetical protein
MLRFCKVSSVSLLHDGGEGEGSEKYRTSLLVAEIVFCTADIAHIKPNASNIIQKQEVDSPSRWDSWTWWLRTKEIFIRERNLSTHVPSQCVTSCLIASNSRIRWTVPLRVSHSRVRRLKRPGKIEHWLNSFWCLMIMSLWSVPCSRVLCPHSLRYLMKSLTIIFNVSASSARMFDCRFLRLGSIKNIIFCRKRLLSLAAQKFVSDIAADAYQHARIRTNAMGGRARTQQSYSSLSAKVSRSFTTSSCLTLA